MSLNWGGGDGPSRRRLLAALGATVSAGALAGCDGDGDGERATDSPTATDTATEAPPTTETQSPTETDTPTETEATTETEPTTPAQGSLDPANYGPPDADATWEPTLSEYFDGGELDESVWSLGIEGHHEGTHCADAGERSFCWTREHVTVDDETNRLRLRTSDEAVPEDEREPAGAEANYTVGAVNTRGNFAQEFGYFEIAARIPDEPGTLPAFWLFHDKFEHDWREIDIYEKNGRLDADVLKMGTWFEQDDDGPDPPDVEGTDNDDRIQVGAGDGTDEVRIGSPVDEQFHVIGLEWAPDALTWYVNGEQVGHVDHPGVAEYLPGLELFLIINGALWEGADWLGSPDDATFPHYHDVEWVRVWQRSDWA